MRSEQESLSFDRSQIPPKSASACLHSACCPKPTTPQPYHIFGCRGRAISSRLVFTEFLGAHRYQSEGRTSPSASKDMNCLSTGTFDFSGSDGIRAVLSSYLSDVPNGIRRGRLGRRAIIDSLVKHCTINDLRSFLSCIV